ncbi:uncharacterized protein LOC110465965 [Mizuhopecten yessoensis]|uniref:uncharacterized protein LOC110465965 n=1 Tax=Mizuhopecten yessoensis TaxID=6573 RepID=UPI000B45EAA4|nr:uncharacterized protein LOC110465965 [Mizuhopecten yessoensis]
MATGNDKQELNKILQSNAFQQCVDHLKKYETVKPVDKTLVDQLKQRLREAVTPELIFDLLADVLDLIGGCVPVAGAPLSIASFLIKGFLFLFGVLSNKSSKIKVFEQQTYIAVNIQRKAFAVQSALSSSIRYLQRIQTRNLNDHEIDILQSQVPRNTGDEFFAELEQTINDLQRGEKEKNTRETEDQTTDKIAGNKTEEEDRKTGEKEEEQEEHTLQRCNAIIALIDLYCVLSCLREFVLFYFVTVFANNRVSENITKSYLERLQKFKNNREALLKVLYEPEAKYASVAAVFLPKKWSKLRHQLGSRLDLCDLLDRPLHIISAAKKEFAMFRYDPNVRKLFTQTRYVRVMANIETKFVLHSEGDQDFKIYLSGHQNMMWKISSDQLEVSIERPSSKGDYFNIVRLSNGNVMFSSQKRPTCFIKMENAKDDARLGVANNGFDKNCQWKIID